jgi:coenzyme F420-reducing hydrogenase beta subunit
MEETGNTENKGEKLSDNGAKVSITPENIDKLVKSLVDSGTTEIAIVGMGMHLAAIDKALLLSSLAAHSIKVIDGGTHASMSRIATPFLGELAMDKPDKPFVIQASHEMNLPYDISVLDDKPFYKKHHTKKSKFNSKKKR